MIYLIVIVLLLFLSFRYDINGKTKGRDEWYLAILIIFILIAGLRWRLGVDTPNYINSFYHRYPALEEFSFEDYPIGKDPFYVLINSIVISMGGRFYMVQIIQAAFVNTLIFKYVRKHSRYIFTSVFFYFLITYFNYNMEIMRGSMSIVICLFANDYVLEKKWVKGYLLYIIALFFHAQTVVLFLLPALFFMRMNKLGVAMLIGAYVAGYILQVGLGDYFELLDMDDAIADKAEGYANSDKYGGQAGNLNFKILKIFPFMFCGILSLLYLKHFYPNRPLLRLEPFIMICIIFSIIQLNLQIAYRYVDYYLIYIALFGAETFVSLIRQCRMSKSVAYVRAFVLFLPFFFLVTYYRFYVQGRDRYFPYTSVVERTVIEKREMVYHSGRSPRPNANRNEY